MAAGRMNACPGWVDGRAWTSMDEHGRGSNHTAGPDEAIRDCACHGTLLVVGGFLLVKIQIKWAFPAASNISALLLCSLLSITACYS